MTDKNLIEFEISPSSASKGGSNSMLMDNILDPDSPITHEAKVRMKEKILRPTGWLNLLCPSWSASQDTLCLRRIDKSFENFKPYLNGVLSAPLLCRIGLKANFWTKIGISDEFDREYVASQVEKFRDLYEILESTEKTDIEIRTQSKYEESKSVYHQESCERKQESAYTAGNESVTSYLRFPGSTAPPIYSYPPPPPLGSSISMYHEIAIPPPSVINHGAGVYTPFPYPQHQQTMSTIDKSTMVKHPEYYNAYIQRKRSNSESPSIQNSSSESPVFSRHAKKLAIERQKQQAYSRVNELVNRADVTLPGSHKTSKYKQTHGNARSQIVVSTAKDLDTIVTQSQLLFKKFSEAAKKQSPKGGRTKVTWNLVAKEIGINIKVREKYARYHSRAKARGFDFKRHGHFKIKDYPQIFMDPLPSREKCDNDSTHSDMANSSIKEQTDINDVSSSPEFMKHVLER